MKIVYCIAGTYRPAGMERVLADKANWWAAHGHEVHILTTDQRGLPPAFAMDPRKQRRVLPVQGIEISRQTVAASPPAVSGAERDTRGYRSIDVLQRCLFPTENPGWKPEGVGSAFLPVQTAAVRPQGPLGAGGPVAQQNRSKARPGFR